MSLSIICFVGYWVLLLAVVLGTVAGRARARGNAAHEPESATLDLLDYAFLSGGPVRVADVVLASMVWDGLLRVTDGGSLARDGRSRPRNTVEELAVNQCWHPNQQVPAGRVRRTLMTAPVVQQRGDRLADLGLLLTPPQTKRIRLPLRALPVVFLLPFVFFAVSLNLLFGFFELGGSDGTAIPGIVPHLVAFGSFFAMHVVNMIMVVFVERLDTARTRAGVLRVRALRHDPSSHTLGPPRLVRLAIYGPDELSRHGSLRDKAMTHALFSGSVTGAAAVSPQGFDWCSNGTGGRARGFGGGGLGGGGDGGDGGGGGGGAGGGGDGGG